MPILPYKGIMPNIAEDVFIAPGAMVMGDVFLLDLKSLTFIGF